MALAQILVVEDDAALRGVIVRMIGKLGYRAVEAASADQALAILEREKIDVLLTDVVLPGGASGIELAHCVIARWPATRVVVTSGATVAGITDQLGPLAQSVRVIGKPYRRDDVAAVLGELLSAS